MPSKAGASSGSVLEPVVTRLRDRLIAELDTGSQEEMAEAAVGLVGAMGAIVAIFGRVSATRTII